MKIIEEVLKNRQTVKEYSDKKISEKDFRQILDTIQWAPSSHGWETYRVLIIEKESKLRNELFPMMWGQGTVINSDKLIFFISLKNKIVSSNAYAEKQGLRRAKILLGKSGEDAIKYSKENGKFVLDKHIIPYEKNDDWSMKQSYIALGMAMYSATILGIGTTPMEGFARDEVEELFLKEKLISEDERVSVALAFGYPKSKTAYAHRGQGTRIRKPFNEKFTFIKK